MPHASSDARPHGLARRAVWSRPPSTQIWAHVVSANPVSANLVWACLACASLLAFSAPAALAEDAPAAEASTDAVLAALKSKDADARLDGATKAKDLQDVRLTSPLTRLLSAKESGIREAAIAALATRADKAGRKKAASALGSRLTRLGKHPAEAGESTQIIEALGDLGQPASIKPLLADIDADTELDEVQARVAAVGRIPDGKAIEALIDFLALGRRGGRAKHRNFADKALRHATGASPHKDNRSAGRDADRWRAWWRENKKTFSFAAIQAERDEAESAAREKEAKQKEKAAKRKAAREKRKNKGTPKDGAKPKPRTKKPAIPD